MPVTSDLGRLLEPVTETFTLEMARKIADIRADPKIQADIDELREKANEGTLTAEEDAQYKDFVEAVDVISIIQAKARRFLARRA